MEKNQTYYFHIKSGFIYTSEVRWLLKTLAVFARIEFIEDERNLNPNCIILADSPDATIQINTDFFTAIYSGEYSIVKTLDSNMNVLNKDGSIDFLSTVFYFINCIWEYAPDSQKDQWGRSEFQDSVWKHFGYDRPFDKVNQLFDSLLRQLKMEKSKEKSTVFLSHDIDVVYGAYKEDGYSLFRKGHFFKSIKLILEHFVNGPHWFNFRKIVELEKKYQARSTFFWLPVKGNEKMVGRNADYNIHSARIKAELEWLEKQGITHGIHKSLKSITLAEELKLMPLEVNSNRYHYLKFDWQGLIVEMNNSGIKLDASLGYAQETGYRNGYTLPFIPFDINKRCPCSFVEVPLTIMDGTFSKYKKQTSKEAFEEIKDFINNHSYNSVISILWHNSHFTDIKYKGYPKLYEDILAYLKNENIETISVNHLIKKYLPGE